jgi:F-type H+-transporting ATPase subunit alpha
MSVEYQVLSVFAANEGYLDTLPVKEVREFEAELHRYIGGTHKELMESVRTTGAMSDEVATKLRAAIEKFLGDFTAQKKATATPPQSAPSAGAPEAARQVSA